MAEAEKGKGKVLRMPCDSLNTLGPAPEPAGHLTQGGHGIYGYQGLPENNKGQQHQNLRCRMQHIARLVKQHSRMLIIEIDVAEGNKCCQSNNRVQPFVAIHTKATNKSGSHRQARASNMGPTKQDPPQENSTFSFHVKIP